MNELLIYLGACIIFWIFMLFSRKRFKIDGLKVFGIPILYVATLDTNLSLKLVDRIAAKFNKLVKIIGWIGVVGGFIVMVVSVAALIFQIWMVATRPELAGQSGVKMILPVQTSGAMSGYAIYVPLWIWVVSIAIIMLVHEGGHALLARAYGIPIKRNGIAIMGLIIPLLPGAFVDPDEQYLKSRPAKEQLAVFAAGSSFNIMFALLVGILSLLLVKNLSPTFNPLRELLQWILLLNLGIGMTNLLPIGPLDGAKMVDVSFKHKVVARAIQITCLFLLLVTIVQGFIK